MAPASSRASRWAASIEDSFGSTRPEGMHQPRSQM